MGNYIDKNIEMDITKLPKGMQHLIAEMEEFEKQGDWISYDNYYDVLESAAKNALLDNLITQKQYSQIEKKYGGYV